MAAAVMAASLIPSAVATGDEETAEFMSPTPGEGKVPKANPPVIALAFAPSEPPVWHEMRFDGANVTAAAGWRDDGVSFTPREPLEGGEHLVEVSLGFDSGAVRTYSWRFIITRSDVEPPKLVILAPHEGASVVDSLEISVNAFDGGVLARILVKVDGIVREERYFTKPIAAGESPPANTTFRATLNVTGLPPGPHVLEAIAFDGAGNSGNASVTFLVPIGGSDGIGENVSVDGGATAAETPAVATIATLTLLLGTASAALFRRPR